MVDPISSYSGPVSAKSRHPYLFSSNLGMKILLSTAKMMTTAMSPVTTVVTMLWMVLRSAALLISALVTGFHTQVNRFITRNTTTVAAK